jgi:hypothetical protein
VRWVWGCGDAIADRGGRASMGRPFQPPRRVIFSLMCIFLAPPPPPPLVVLLQSSFRTGSIETGVGICPVSLRRSESLGMDLSKGFDGSFGFTR